MLSLDSAQLRKLRASAVKHLSFGPHPSKHSLRATLIQRGVKKSVMVNVTIAVDNRLLRSARIKALAKKVRVTHEPRWPGREAPYSDPGVR